MRKGISDNGKRSCGRKQKVRAPERTSERLSGQTTMHDVASRDSD